MAKTLDDLMKIKGVAACGAWRPTDRNRKIEIIGSRGEIPQEGEYIASAFCELDLFLANSQCAVYEQYTRQEKFFPVTSIAIRGKEFSVMAAYAKEEDYMVGVFMLNSDRPDLWELSDIMKEIRV